LVYAKIAKSWVFSYNYVINQKNIYQIVKQNIVQYMHAHKKQLKRLNEKNILSVKKKKCTFIAEN